MINGAKKSDKYYIRTSKQHNNRIKNSIGFCVPKCCKTELQDNVMTSSC